MNRLKELRIKYHLSLRKLQEYTGIDFSRLAVIEKTYANLELKTIEKLCSFFKVSDTYLFGKDGLIFYYDERNAKYFPLPYEQYKDLLTDDVVSYSISQNCIKRTISLKCINQIINKEKTARDDLDLRIQTENFLSVLDELDDFSFKKQKDRILQYFKIEETRRCLRKNDSK